jgi:polyisoprenyl-teichoic acid--peptidoglycan teichoic acid transferase
VYEGREMVPGGATPGAGRRRPGGKALAWAAALAAALALLVTGAIVVNRATRPTGVAGPTAAAPTASATPSAQPTPAPQPGAGIKGPLNLLIVGVDTRINVRGWEPHADAVLIMHITKNLDRAYVFSLPRDLLVDVPSYPRAGFSGRRTKLTHAMSYGSRVPGRRLTPSTAQGFALLSTTVSRYTGIRRFDAGAVLTFTGFDNLVDALGGVDLYIDQRVASIHRRPNGWHRTLGSGGYVGPQMVYQPGMRHLVGWQALDYARQRYIPGGDYARQRHQQQLIKATVRKILSQNLARDQARLERVVRALGQTLTFQGGGRRVVDFAYALSRLRPEAITLVGLTGSSVFGGSGYRGEQLKPLGRQFIAELRAGRAPAFLARYPSLVIRG